MNREYIDTAIITLAIIGLLLILFGLFYNPKIENNQYQQGFTAGYASGYQNRIDYERGK